MTDSPLAALDSLIGPICVAANKLRQVRDALPVHFWTVVPAVFREPVDALFFAVEQYDRKVGLLREAGFMPAKGVD